MYFCQSNSITPSFARFIIAFLFLCSVSFAQTQYHDFGFERSQQIGVLSQSGIPLLYPWAGGMNSVRFSEIDLNLDGQKDLFIFEKNGNRILPFINNGTHYHYAPEYIRFFPKLHDWVILADYNHDGLADIFTYGLAGISVYQNITRDQLQFELVQPALQSYYYNGYSNIYSSPDDYLVIEDLDNDGDLDILNFWLLGKYVHYQRNYAMELTGNSEVFDFRLEDECWGKFSEGADNNVITLHANCNDRRDESNSRHVGSSMLAYDYNRNGVYDLILGDVDYPEVVYLHNGGTPDSAIMTSQTSFFPNVLQPIHLYSMPVINFIDLNHDGKKELIASPSDPSLTKSQNLQSVWCYQFDDILNTYTLQTTSFLQEEMIDVGSGAYPLFYDWDRDGLQDLFIGNYGIYDSSNYVNGFLNSYYSSSIAYYQNIGTAIEPKFKLITTDFGHLKQYNYQALYPAFGDLDGNGEPELICGNSDGNLLYFSHYPFTVPNSSFADIHVGNYSAPQLFDLDGDGKLDLIIGNRRGQIVYYKNNSTNSSLQFELITSTLGNVDVRDFNLSYFGYSTPLFFKNSRNETVLFCGSEQGRIYYYKNIDQNLSGSFELGGIIFETFSNSSNEIIEGIRIGIGVTDLNQNGYLDLAVGNFAGGISFFNGMMPPVVEIETHPWTQHCKIYPNPTQSNVSVEGDNMVRIDIYNPLGQLMQSIENQYKKTNITLDLQNFSSGIYLIRITTEHQIESQKLILVD